MNIKSKRFASTTNLDKAQEDGVFIQMLGLNGDDGRTMMDVKLLIIVPPDVDIDSELVRQRFDALAREIQQGLKKE